MHRNIILMSLLLIASHTSAQIKTTRGFLFPDSSPGKNLRLHLYLPFDIDSSLSLKENLLRISHDTLMRVQMQDVPEIGVTRIENEDNKNLISVVPVKATWGEWTLEVTGILESFMPYPITFYNKRIVEGYNEKEFFFLKNIQIIDLPLDD